METHVTRNAIRRIKTQRAEMTLAQEGILAAADLQSRIIPDHVVDGRSMPRLARLGWAVRVQQRKRGRKVWYRWEITDAGLEALAHGEIVTPVLRPDWRGREVARLSGNEYVVDGHTISRPARTMLWRLMCPARGAEPVGYGTVIAEVADMLFAHLHAEAEHGIPRDPTVPLVEQAVPVNLDLLF